MANRERPQLGASLEENSLIPPEVVNLASTARIMVEERKLWQSRKKGIAVFINGTSFSEKPEAYFNSSNWQVTKPGTKEKIVSIVISLPRNVRGGTGKEFLENSTDFRRDYRKFKEGYGRVYEAPCTCRVRCDIKGEMMSVYACSDHERGVLQEIVPAETIILKPRNGSRAPKLITKPWLLTKKDDEEFKSQWEKFMASDD